MSVLIPPTKKRDSPERDGRGDVMISVDATQDAEDAEVTPAPRSEKPSRADDVQQQEFVGGRQASGRGGPSFVSRDQVVGLLKCTLRTPIQDSEKRMIQQSQGRPVLFSGTAAGAQRKTDLLSINRIHPCI